MNRLCQTLRSFLTMLLLVILLPGMARAEDSVCSGGVCLGTGSMTNPVPGCVDDSSTASCSTGWSGSYVYYGKYNGKPVLYRVLNIHETAFGGNTLLLDCDSLLEKVRFYTSDTCYSGNWSGCTTEWADSTINSWLNGQNFLDNPSVFTPVEKAAIAASKKIDAAKNDGTSIENIGWVSLSGEKIFLLDAREATNTSYGYRGGQTNAEWYDDARIKSLFETNTHLNWWLRSPYELNYSAGASNQNGHVYIITVVYGNGGVSPVFNVNLSSVIFSSVITSEASNISKLSLLDENLKISLQSGKNPTIEGNTIMIPYNISGANAENATRVIVLVTNKIYDPESAGWESGAEIKQIEFLVNPEKTGTISFEFDTDTYDLSKWGSDYHVWLVAEVVNNGEQSNYASAPVELNTVPEHVHDWIYTADGAVITAACNTPGHSGGNAALTLSAPVGDLTYDGTAKTASYILSPEDTDVFGTPEISYKQRTSTSVSAPINVGDYIAVVTLTGVKTAAGVDQTVTALTTFSISPAAIKIKTDDKTKVYDNDKSTDPALTATVTGKPEKGAVPVYTLNRTDGQDVNSYPITVTADADANLNYTIGVEEGTFSINPAAIKIKVDDKTKVYDNDKSTDPALTATVMGKPEKGAVPVYTLSRTDGQDVNNYPITVNADAAENPNYTVSVEEGIFSITAAKITASAADEKAVYDGQPHIIEVTVTEPVRGAVVKFSDDNGNSYTLTECPEIKNVSESPLTIYYQVTAKNYEPFSGSAVVTILPGKATVKANAQTIREGESIETGLEQAKLSGVVAGHTLSAVKLTVSGDRIIPSDARIIDGTTQKGLRSASDTMEQKTGTDVTDNYDISYEAGSLTVRVAVSYTVTFSVVNGAWNDGRTEDIVLTLEGYEGDDLKLKAEDIPAVGEQPAEGYTAGSWDTKPSAKTVITADTVYKYTYKSKPAPQPFPEPYFGLDFFRIWDGIELPATGFSSSHATPLSDQPKDLSYKPTRMILQIPDLNVETELVMVPLNGSTWPVEWLRDRAGLLEGSALPGEGIAVIAGHNTLNDTEYGPFAAVAMMQPGDRFFVNGKNGLLIFEVYANSAIGSNDTDALIQAAGQFGNTLTLLTCENEMPEGSYASRRIVSAKLVE